MSAFLFDEERVPLLVHPDGLGDVALLVVVQVDADDHITKVAIQLKRASTSCSNDVTTFGSNFAKHTFQIKVDLEKN